MGKTSILRLRSVLLKVALTALTGVSAFCQSTFQNLDFESPITPLVPQPPLNTVPISNALPYWSGYIGPIQATTVLYNNRTVGSASLDLMGSGTGIIYQGQYTVLLQAGSSPSGQVGASIAQIGMIPTDVNSLRFWAFGPAIDVTFSGQSLSLVPLVSGPGLGTLLGADISVFAGQAGELRFTAPNLSSIGFPNDVFLDDISFSPEAVPEPGVFGLFVLGTLLLRWRFWNQRI